MWLTTTLNPSRASWVANALILTICLMYLCVWWCMDLGHHYIAKAETFLFWHPKHLPSFSHLTLAFSLHGKMPSITLMTNILLCLEPLASSTFIRILIPCLSGPCQAPHHIQVHVPIFLIIQTFIHNLSWGLLKRETTRLLPCFSFKWGHRKWYHLGGLYTQP